MYPVTLVFDIDEEGNHVKRKVHMPFPPFVGLVVRIFATCDCSILDDLTITEVAWCLQTDEITAETQLTYEPAFEVTEKHMIDRGWVSYRSQIT